MPSSNLSKRIREAWDARWSGALEDTLKRLPELSIELGFQLLGHATHEVEHEWKQAAFSTREGLEQSDAILLGASILRIHGKMLEAQSAIERAQRCLLASGLHGSFRYHFERGLLHFAQGFSFSALEDFFAAERFTREPLFRLIALSNAIFCMENAGIEHQNVLEDVEGLGIQLKNSAHPVYQANERQLLAYQMRLLARQGRFSKAVELSETRTLRVQNQASFYARYLSLLPYSSSYRPLSSAEQQYLLQEPENFYQKGYLIRTLLGTSHANDLEATKLSDRIDRLYLWTWTWLYQPDAQGAERLLSALSDVIQTFNPNLLTLEDQSLLRNALGWIGLIDPSLLKTLGRVAQQVASASGHFELFDFEWSIIQYFSLLQRGEKTKAQDTFRQMKHHPLWKSKEITLAQLLTDPEHVVALKISKLKQKVARASQAQSLSVDLNTFVIEDKNSESQVVSEIIALGLKALLEQKSIRVETFAQQVFKIYRYDEFVHLPKVNNLISRIKKLTRNHLSIKVRAGTIMAQADSVFKISFTEPNALSELLRSQVLSFKTPSSLKRISTQEQLTLGTLLSTFHQKQKFTREEIQASLGQSKSSVNRFIEKLILKKVLARSGMGRSTIYQFVHHYERSA